MVVEISGNSVSAAEIFQIGYLAVPAWKALTAEWCRAFGQNEKSDYFMACILR